MYSADTVYQKVAPLINQFNQQSLFSGIDTFEKMQNFMKYDVFTCWDCMCLIKALYSSIVSVNNPWFPPKDAFSASLLCHIMGEEESDIAFDGKTYLSHFDIYLAAMRRAKADTHPIMSLIHTLEGGGLVQQSLAQCGIEVFVQRYVNTTFSFFSLQAHQLASAFAFGREALAPNLFVSLLQHLKNHNYFDEKDKLSELIYFCNRHIELDGSSHFPKMLTMLNNLCEQDEKKWEEVLETAIIAIQAKIEFYHSMQQSFVQQEYTV
jgi:hypothetical protein